MIKIELYEDEFILNKSDLKINKYPELNSIDCKMRITIEDKIFYDDWICPLEFYYQFKSWYVDVKMGKLRDFAHETIETDNNPIILFTFDREKNQCTFGGTFTEYCDVKTYTTQDILELFERFEIQLKAHIK